MKCCAIAILCSVLASPLASQTIQQVSITAQAHDEPPTRQGRREQYVVTYTRDQQNNLVATHYFCDGKKIGLRTKATISEDARRQVEQWQNSNEKSFLFKSFDSDESLIRKRQSDPIFGLTRELPGQLIIELDSFSYCQPHLMRKTLTIGGAMITVDLKSDGKRTSFQFDSSTDRNGSLDIYAYLLCYRLLQGALPGDFFGSQYFSRQALTTVILHYFKVIECEGYYYQEYKMRNPERTPGEIRQGWDLKRYLIEKHN